MLALGGSRLRLIIESRLDAVGLVGKLVNTACASAGVSRLDCYQAEVCVVEAVNNCVKHAYQGRPGNEVEVAISFSSGEMKFEIIDHGLPGDPAQLLLDRRDRLELDPKNVDSIPESGRGIAIIQAVMDGIQYHSSEGVNRLSMTKRIGPTEVAP